MLSLSSRNISTDLKIPLETQALKNIAFYAVEENEELSGPKNVSS